MPDVRTHTVATPTGLLSIDSHPEPSRARRRREAEHHRFLGDHWTELKAASHGGYREYGAGAVVLWREDTPSRWRPRPFEPERLWYTTQIHVLPGATEADFSGWESELLETYTPDTEALVVFVEGTSFAGYRLRGSTSPREAHRGTSASLN
ncbi:MAG: hypothetical protein AAF791_06095 [Bacteroidota bacterium]